MPRHGVAWSPHCRHTHDDTLADGAAVTGSPSHLHHEHDEGERKVLGKVCRPGSHLGSGALWRWRWQVVRWRFSTVAAIQWSVMVGESTGGAAMVTSATNPAVATVL
jgi:hypothetical protein